MKKNEFLDYIKYLGIFVFSAGAGAGISAGGTKLAFDLIDDHYKKMSQGLPLIQPGAHLKEGNHRVVITGDFWQAIVNEPEDAKKFVMDGISTAYDDLNKLNTKLSFELCTTEDGLEKYNVKKIDEINDQDISLHITEEYISNNQHVMAITNWNKRMLTREIYDNKITYRKDYLLTAWRSFGLKEDILSPYNSVAYAITAHESMHAMGIAHVEADSIMRSKSSYYYKDITQLDKEIIDKYNVVFYGTTPKYDYKNLDEYNKALESTKSSQDELELNM